MAIEAEHWLTRGFRSQSIIGANVLTLFFQAQKGL